jgi:acyl carrier protein
VTFRFPPGEICIESLSSASLVAKLLVEVQRVQPALIVSDAMLAADLCIDSLELLDLGMALEDHYGIALKADALIGIETVGDLVGVVEDARYASDLAAGEAVSERSQGEIWLRIYP